jgi:hypothetical protein
MDIYGKIKEKIRNIAGDGKRQSFVVFTAQVESVDGEICTVKLDELSIADVRLRSVVNNNSEQILITPKAGSYVLVVDLSGGSYSDLAVIGFSEVEKVNVKISDMNIFINHSGVKIENQNENLFATISDFITEVQKIIVVQGTSPNVAALNLIKQRLNKILK